MKYRDKSYFNENDTYLFDNGMRRFESKVYFTKSNWWTEESLKYKATTLECKKLNN